MVISAILPRSRKGLAGFEVCDRPQPVWLGEATIDPSALLHPPADDVLRCWPIGTRVNSPRNNGPELPDPVGAA